MTFGCDIETCEDEAMGYFSNGGSLELKQVKRSRDERKDLQMQSKRNTFSRAETQMLN